MSSTFSLRLTTSSRRSVIWRMRKSRTNARSARVSTMIPPACSRSMSGCELLRDPLAECLDGVGGGGHPVEPSLVRCDLVVDAEQQLLDVAKPGVLLRCHVIGLLLCGDV